MATKVYRFCAWGVCGLIVLGLMIGCKKGSSGLSSRMAQPTMDDIVAAQRNATQVSAASPSPLPVSLLPIQPVAPLRETGLREIAADALARIGYDAVPELMLALGDRDRDVRVSAARALARMGPAASPAVPALMQALNDPDELVRQNAARALGQIGPDARPAIPALIAALRQRSG